MALSAMALLLVALSAVALLVCHGVTFCDVVCSGTVCHDVTFGGVVCSGVLCHDALFGVVCSGVQYNWCSLK